MPILIYIIHLLSDKTIWTHHTLSDYRKFCDLLVSNKVFKLLLFF